MQNVDLEGDTKIELQQTHGYIFEVPAEGVIKPAPLKAMDRFVYSHRICIANTAPN